MTRKILIVDPNHHDTDGVGPPPEALDETEERPLPAAPAPGKARQSAYGLESGVAIPPKARRGGRPSPFPFEHMLPGQSFFVPSGNDPQKVVLGRLSGSARRFEMQITTRSLIENGVRGVRVWRIDGLPK